MTLLLRRATEFYSNLKAVASEIPGPIERHSGRLLSMAKVGREADAVLDALSQAQAFVLDKDADLLLTSMAHNAKAEGAEEIFWTAPLVFDTLWLERELPDGKRDAFLLSRKDDDIYGLSFMLNGDFFAPSLVLLSAVAKDRTFKSAVTEYHTFATRYGAPHQSAQWDALKDDQSSLIPFGILEARMLSTLIAHPDMVRAGDPAPVFSRQERRRAQRDRKPLPAVTVSRITLGEFGKGQLSAMQDGSHKGSGTARRSHWVRGHWMRNRAGGVSWRMPHLRGIGPLVAKERHVTSDPEIGTYDLGI